MWVKSRQRRADVVDEREEVLHESVLLEVRGQPGVPCVPGSERLVYPRSAAITGVVSRIAGTALESAVAELARAGLAAGTNGPRSFSTRFSAGTEAWSCFTSGVPSTGDDVELLQRRLRRGEQAG